MIIVINIEIRIILINMVVIVLELVLCGVFFLFVVFMMNFGVILGGCLIVVVCFVGGWWIFVDVGFLEVWIDDGGWVEV